MDKYTLNKGARRVMFYLRNFGRYFSPKFLHKTYSLSKLSSNELEIVQRRVSYYANIPQDASIEKSTAISVKDFKYPFRKKKKYATYFFDLYPYVYRLPPDCYFKYIFGDVDWEADSPTFTKARPITGKRSNNIICKFNHIRHFLFVNDKISFHSKKDKLVFRNIVRKQPQRQLFIETFMNHPLCDVGQTNNDEYTLEPKLVKPFMPIEEQLEYKFIACIEGHDVATNLKWVMSSNSIAVMPRPKFESWFMEGTLIPDFHYIEINEDYSDLAEKLEYYIQNQEKAERIIKNAHIYVEQFKNPKLEKVIMQEVVNTYFKSVKTH